MRKLYSLGTLGLGAVVVIAARDVSAMVLWMVFALALVAEGGRR